ncbi:transcriptional regulator [Kribbella italica]|uniref:DNA-binding MarR family transcriptional regulator n=1 Tax=Kribbella italica TaxID=1540520 RepID=A0A7W9MRW6_9ACTN|nr:transcriptional regulator [Kribbella italica]MBB5833298.1 DNA-binding MarR family transcriptional regulator [Kribbella italica]
MTARFDEIIHSPHRLRICAFLSGVDSGEFAIVRDFLEVSDATLSKQLKILAAAGYLEISKPTGRGRIRTWLRLTQTGRSAYQDHAQALRHLVDADLQNL